MNKKLLPLRLTPYEIGFLILLGTAFYVSMPALGPKTWQLLVYEAALIAAIVVLILRCQDEWRQLPYKWFFFSLTTAWVTLFVFYGNTPLSYPNSGSLPGWMFSQYTSPLLDEGHGLLIPFVVLVLYWWKRKELTAQPARLWWPALGMIVFALLLHFAGFMSQQQRLSVVAFFLGLYALTGLAWGWHWLKASFFPFFLLAFCVPISEFSGPLTLPLRLLVARIVEIVAHLGLAPDLIREGNLLMDGQHTFAYEVAPACSGIRSLVALLALMTIYGFINFKPAWKRLVMMLIAMPLAVLGNVVRLCLTIAVAETFGQGAGKAVETKFGFITFLVALGCALLVARWLEKTEVNAPSSGKAGPDSPDQTLTGRPVTP